MIVYSDAVAPLARRPQSPTHAGKQRPAGRPMAAIMRAAAPARRVVDRPRDAATTPGHSHACARETVATRSPARVRTSRGRRPRAVVATTRAEPPAVVNMPPTTRGTA